MCSIAAAQGLNVAALVLVSYPLHPPGKPDKLRVEHLGAIGLDLPGMRDDVDTWDDVERVRDRVGKHTRTYLNQLART